MNLFELLREVERSEGMSNEALARLIRQIERARIGLHATDLPINVVVADLYAGLLDAHRDNLYAVLRKRESPAEGEKP